MAHDIDDWNQPEIESDTSHFDVELPRPYRWHSHGTQQRRIVQINSWSNEAKAWGNSVSDFYPVWGFGAQTGDVYTPQTFPFLEGFTDVGTLFGEQSVIGYASGSFLDGGFAVLILADGTYWFCGYSTTGISADGFAGAAPTNLREFWTQTAIIPGTPADLRYVSCGDGALILHYRNGDCWVVGGKFYTVTSIHGLNRIEGNITTFTKMAERVRWVFTLDSATVICKSDGRLKCTGLNAHGRFGLAEDPDDDGTNGTINPSGTVWYTVPSAHWTTGGGFVKAELQRLATPNTLGCMLALKADGTLWFAGNNQTRMCGDPAKDSTYQTGALHQVPDIPLLLDFCVTGTAVFALTVDHELWTWGQGDFNGELATGNYEETTPGVRLTGVKQIKAKHKGGIAVKLDESLYVWGEGSTGKNGNGYSGVVSTPRSQRVPATSTPEVEATLLLGEPMLTITSG